MIDIEIRYNGDPNYSKGCGYAEIKCPCGSWANFSLTHWDDDNEEEYGEIYEIHCSNCGREGRGDDDDDEAISEFMNFTKRD